MRRIGDRWIEGGTLYVETERGPDVDRGTCDACELPAVCVDLHDGTRQCYRHSYNQAYRAREARKAAMDRRLNPASPHVCGKDC